MGRRPVNIQYSFQSCHLGLRPVYLQERPSIETKFKKPSSGRALGIVQRLADSEWITDCVNGQSAPASDCIVVSCMLRPVD